MTLKALSSALLLGLTLAPAAFAHPAQPPASQVDLERMQLRFERKVRLMRLLAITDALNLSDAAALQLDQLMAKYDLRKRPLQEKIIQGVQVLRRAARGDATADTQVDATLNAMVQARSQLHAIEFQMFQEIAKGLSPQQRAKLALAMARLPAEMRDLARHEHHGQGPGHDEED